MFARKKNWIMCELRGIELSYTICGDLSLSLTEVHCYLDRKEICRFDIRMCLHNLLIARNSCVWSASYWPHLKSAAFFATHLFQFAAGHCHFYLNWEQTRSLASAKTKISSLIRTQVRHYIIYQQKYSS